MATTLQDLAKDAGTQFILALFVDLRGKPCAKLVPVEAVELLATEGVGFAGYADQRERVSGLEALICDVISKPFALAEIKFAVASALAKGKR